MKRPDILNFDSGLSTDELNFTTWETNTTITLRARDIHGVVDQPVTQEFPADSGPVSTIYWNDNEILVRRSRTDILADIAALVGTTPLTYVSVRDEKAQSTDSGTFTSGSFQTRDLNVIQSDLGSLASLSANQLTLLSGTYVCSVVCPGYQVARHQARLQNITDAATTLLGTTLRSGSGTFHSGYSFIVGLFQILATKTFEVQHQCQTSRSNDGFGEFGGFTTEVFTVAEFRRIGD